MTVRRRQRTGHSTIFGDDPQVSRVAENEFVLADIRKPEHACRGFRLRMERGSKYDGTDGEEPQCPG
jgi:hypothetical protein